MSTLLRRVEEASRYVPLNRLALSPQCGFATSVPGNRISENDQWAKIDLLIGLAHRLWG
jgi:5-methyltetrahydropteroyltriglutamate--homocysteine methyltransferase